VNSPAGQATPVRSGEELDWAAVRAYLGDRLGLSGSLKVLQFPNGAANLTYLLDFGDTQLVLRRPPFGELAVGAHDMRREFRVLSQLWRCYDRAPRGLLFCDDHSIVGADFLVSEYRAGEGVWSTIPDSMAGVPDAAWQIGLAVVDALADLHLVVPKDCGLADFGRPGGFAERQMRSWQNRWERVAAPDADALVRAVGADLAARVPRPARAAVLHNDFKIDNCQFAGGDPGRVAAVFDWDMATVADPLVDLGILLNYWPDPGDAPDDRALAYPGLDRLGLPSRLEVVRRYASRTGSDCGDLNWYEAFASWKTAIVREQLHYRFVCGDSTDPRMADMHDNVVMLARRARRLLDECR
jgi:aminoglycoside phosphotransferase (APT) family kinase protein